MNYEMGALGDSSHFAVFDLFIQPRKNEARYGLSIGACRCHHRSIEIGYMYTGMWKVDTVNNYKCHWRGGCSGVGISDANIEKARVALESYALKDLRVGRRLLSERDTEENFHLDSPQQLEGDRENDEEDYEGDEEDYEDEQDYDENYI